MANISQEEFKLRRKDSEVFSVISDFRGDDISAIRIFQGFQGEGKFIFESGGKENYFGRYSYLSENPYKEIMGNEYEEIEKIKKEVTINFNSQCNSFTFKGGAIGYIGYDSVAFYEKKLSFKNKDELNVPTVRFNFYKRYLCYDNFTHRVYVVDNIFYDDNRTYEEIMEEQKEYFYKLAKNKDFLVGAKGETYEEFKKCEKNEKEYKYKKCEDVEKNAKCKVEFKLSIPKDEFIKKIERAKEYIVQGDIFQVVLSERMYCKTDKTPFEIYRRLREENPSPYMFLIDYKEYQVIGSSPESLVALKGNKVVTNPIAGTRKRGNGELEDNILAKELIEDKKELAEHVMLVDLGRNDIGRVSKCGTVEVGDFMKVEKFSHVMHITSKVIGEIREDKDAFHALAACLPVGTVSGAPKIRAMEIIEELESVRRGIYSGAVGYFSYGGNMDMSIAIRTLVLKDGVAYLQAGAGIVYDSIPEKEFDEIENKLLVLKEVLR
ncbi:MAG: chorismate-binding protein [Clostridium sp.]